MSKEINKSLKTFDYEAFIGGQNFNCYDHFGCHLVTEDEVQGARFTLWAPAAKEVRVVGSFNYWDGENSLMEKDDNGVWSLFVEGVREGDYYMYDILGFEGERVLKADPYGFYSQLRPGKASVVINLDKFHWTDDKWLKERAKKNLYKSPINIYEVHAGSWKLQAEGKFYNFRELADHLVRYVKDMGYTHIELMPITEHPLDESWGYQTIGYYALTSRYGTPEDFMYFVNTCHEKGIGVIMDWVPGHYCKDKHGLYKFDGTYLYESLDAVKRENYDWGTANFDFGKGHVHSFLISNVLFWLKKYHIDGIRIDAVANMMYLNYGMKQGMNIKNAYGGHENLDAIEFLRKLNEVVFSEIENPLMMAEDSSIRAMVTAPTYLGGIGFNYKWNMGWMNSVLNYVKKDPIYRKWHHDNITYTMTYTYTENFLLPLSHDEVVHGKGSIINKMSGDYWQKFAGSRLLFGYMMGHPGKKLLFMGGEFGQFSEWNCKKELDWMLLQYPAHHQLHHYCRDLNHLYMKEKALWELDHDPKGFTWLDYENADQSIIAFMRKDEDGDYIILLCNFTPVVYYDYKIGVPELTEYKEIFNSDDYKYGGSGQVVEDVLQAFDEEWKGQPYHIKTKVPPLAFVAIKAVAKDKE
ncbi:MAG: 1,4-alpha-glucan branching protein GlgB [Clostridiales bacterium]|uniref:1,4-alpha-glucan branching protein GlgB n=1 Tax=Clostridium sp. N3C TaxID=1776758 RepID=UPI00092E0CDD|nr:1,4-alpha-glucan branching protein GlgB [Clostridium sp. N3C]NLZ47179.1 1,4-alpha-glucan branching protein GlgB [Clostridiales bacterium]SCN23592.1 1,4-alpha-glucan branching enzyme GlgB [Clostridium sp. N3C]